MCEPYIYRKYSTQDHSIYSQSLNIRNELLRMPLGKDIYAENLEIEKNNVFFGAFDCDRLIGTLSCYEEVDGVLHLTAFAVKSEYQRKGIGKKLVEMLCKDEQIKGYREIRVDARETAVSFYQKCGFEVSSGSIINKTLGVVDVKMIYTR